MSLIKIDSVNRLNFNTTTAANFSIRATNTVFQGKYELKSVLIPITFFNIGQYNNLINFTDLAGSHTAVITPGFYTTATYIAAIGSSMTAVAGGSIYTAILNAIPQCLTITSSSSAFTLTFGTNQTNSSSTAMGFSAQNTGSAFSQTGSGLVNVSQTRSFNISINNCVNISNLNGAGYSFIIPVTGFTPSIQLYEPSTNFKQSFNIDSPCQTLNIAVYDDNHRLLTMYSDFYMILEQVQYVISTARVISKWEQFLDAIVKQKILH